MKQHYVSRGVKLLLLIGLGIITILLLALLYLAFIYSPKSTDYKSEYLSSTNSQYIELDGYNAHYIKMGEGKPVIFIHGGGSWLYSFRENIAYCSNGFTAYGVDMPGHGYTQVLQKNAKYNLDMYCDFILEFINKQNIDKVSLVGNSWGGGWALYFTQQHPERVEKLILINSSGLTFHDVFEWEIFKLPIIGEAVSKFINYDSVKYSLEKVFHNQEKVNNTMINEILYPLQNEENREAQYIAERNLDWHVTENNISDITAPTLIIWGKEDKYLDYKFAYEFQKKIKNSEVMIIENCGHVAHEDCPEVLNKAIYDFLNK